MIPRIFVSSTYYDLKHVRERLESFINNYGFEPVLFESDKVTYQHGRPIDQSAYYEVGLCHIMVLIIGGRYGSQTSVDNLTVDREKYDEEFISITRREFETAVQKNIPILIFIDKNVNSDYETYKENQGFFDSESPDTIVSKRKFKFAHVDHTNVFKFMDLVRGRPIKTFEKVEEIEIYLKAQFSGLFYLYLESLKRKAEDNKILNTISELNNITLRMNEMLNSVGKEILGKDEKEYKKVIDNQLSILFDFFCDNFFSLTAFVNTFSEEELNKIDIVQIARILYFKSLKISIPTLPKWKDFEEYKKFAYETDNAILNPIRIELTTLNKKLVLKKFDYRVLNTELKQKVLPFIRNEADENELIRRIAEKIEYLLCELPF